MKPENLTFGCCSGFSDVLTCVCRVVSSVNMVTVFMWLLSCPLMHQVQKMGSMTNANSKGLIYFFLMSLTNSMAHKGNVDIRMTRSQSFRPSATVLNIPCKKGR